ncbi:uncharacterized protein LOC141594957 [Silene latifolia]|uniref:uncharacterized protein LOC141594957 n=1 Tax=Silene latifolia TaxID=37657 RepID=UPI003D772AA4
MGGVMRTTQRLESENSFFKRFESKSGTLVEFSLRFDSAMDQQRHTQKKLGNVNRHTSPKYQRIWLLRCTGRKCTVISCRMIERKGILCWHVIWFYSSNGLETIPDGCVVNIWCKDATRSKIFDFNGEAAEDVDIIDGKQIAILVMWPEIHQTVGMLMGKCKVDVDNFSSLIREFKEKLSTLGSLLNKQQQLEQILGCSVSQGVTILPPKKSKNKGSGKRMLSLKAKAVALARKPKRMCKNCKRLANHDKRNYPNPFAEHPPF